MFHFPYFAKFPPDFVKCLCFLHAFCDFRAPRTLTMMHLCITQCTYWTPLHSLTIFPCGFSFFHKHDIVPLVLNGRASVFCKTGWGNGRICLSRGSATVTDIFRPHQTTSRHCHANKDKIISHMFICE